MDQLIAQKIGQDNKMPSLELGLESLAMVGDCENANCGVSRRRLPTARRRRRCRPRPTRARCSSGSSAIPRTRRRPSGCARIQENRSLLDSLIEDVDDLQRRVGSGDRAKVNEYLEAVREVERRIQKAEKENARPAADHGRAARRAGGVRRPRQADVRPPGAGVPERLDPRHAR